MTRVRVWYDSTCDQIFISGEMHSYAPRSLDCRINGDGSVILIHLAGSPDTAVAGGQFSDFGGEDGVPFATADATKAYLDVVFSRWPETYAVLQETAAAVPLGGHRVVRSGPAGIVYASAEEAETVDMVLGVTVSAVDAGAAPAIVASGPIREPSWSWRPGPIYLGLDGLLTQSAPARGAVLQVAVSVTPTEIFVAIQEPYHLAA